MSHPVYLMHFLCVWSTVSTLWISKLKWDLLRVKYSGEPLKQTVTPSDPVVMQYSQLRNAPGTLLQRPGAPCTRFSPCTPGNIYIRHHRVQPSNHGALSNPGTCFVSSERALGLAPHPIGGGGEPISHRLISEILFQLLSYPPYLKKKLQSLSPHPGPW